MPKHSLRISLAQINTIVGDLNGNFEKMLSAIRAVEKEKSELIIFPELTTTGYPPEDLLFQKRFITDNLETLRRILSYTQKTALIVGFVDRDKTGRLYNAAAFLHKKRLIRVYHKHELPNYGVFDEKRYFAAGVGGESVSFKNIPLGLSICEDIWEKKSFVYQKSYVGRAALLVNISASPYHMNKQDERLCLVRNLAKKTRANAVYLNLVGGQDELVFDGGSFAVNRFGELLGQAKSFEEDLLTIDIPLTLLSPTVRIYKIPRPAGGNRAEEVYKALVLGTRDYIQKNRFKKVLIGLSGGIDSALVARIAVDALGSENVIGVTMPSPYTSKATYSDAKRLAGNLKIKCFEFNIKSIFDSYHQTLDKVFSGHPKDTTEENLQARIRGNLLMALSNKWGYLVLTTGNKSEMATGYCTLYGDMAGGFAVLKDVPKTLVFQLAHARNESEPKNSIPKSILKRPPTAELRFNQKDQDTLPPYNVLDRFLELYVEKNFSVDEITKKRFSEKIAGKVAKMVDLNEYKRRQSPPGIKITPRAFGRDRRMPITNRYGR